MLLQRAIERLFGTTIRRDERRLVALLTIDLFILLTVYYVLKIVREPLILLEGGVVSRNAARGTQAIILLLLVPIYGFLADRMPPRRLVTIIFGSFLASLLAFPVLVHWRVPLGFVFFVWLGIFSITAVAQFWSLANDLFSEEAGKRLFPIVAAGATVGAVAGSQIVVLSSRWLTPPELVLVSAGWLAVSVLVTHIARRAAESTRSARPATVLDPRPHHESPNRRGGFRLLLTDRYLLLIGLSILVLNLVNTTGDQVMALLVQDRAARIVDKAARARFMLGFYGNFQTWVSVLTAVMQVFVVGRILRATGVRGAMMVLPMLAFAGYGLLAAAPVLLLTRGLKIFENSTGYSLQNTVQQVLFLPTSRDAKYKGKAATDTFFVRVGDLASWGLVSYGLHAGWGPKTLSLVNVVAALVWLGLALLLARRYQALASDARARSAYAVPLRLEPAPARVRSR